ncbi:MAG: 2-oxoglutarate dehydrogenase complex dihydrolipoyllysine-residue succinyltransferase [Acidobacteriota bacterium]|nr:MAG: 2-oxoglutarate dehydrogenase complex dihydrolipoyllysine-residue succinyltransferase [Acidobacteriota bacterium]
MGESVIEVEIGDWLKSEGDVVDQDEPLVVIESDKVTVELPAPFPGRLKKILQAKGSVVSVGTTVGTLERAEKPNGEPAAGAGGEEADEPGASSPPAPSAVSGPPPARAADHPRVMPSAQRLLHERRMSPQDIEATGPGGRILKEDVLRQDRAPRPAPSSAPRPAASPSSSSFSAAPALEPLRTAWDGERAEQVVPMSRLRRRIAERLVEAQQTAALLTTFNEIDMSAVIALRNQYKQAFVERHGVKLGFMSFFVKASIEALSLIPQINAEVRGDDIVYRHYYDIGVAVGGGRGLVVPVLRDADRMSFAQIEQAIADLAGRAQTNELTLEELQGGTFTISNGGVYGSLLSTPIVNPPQSGILGLHAIQDRPVAIEGEVLVRPMMYVALTYDHRIVDGREAVTFLKRIKETIEQPARLLLEI